MFSVTVLKSIFAESHFTVCHSHFLSDVMLSMVMFSVHLMSVVKLTAVGLSVVVMIGVAPSVKASLSIFCHIFNQ